MAIILEWARRLWQSTALRVVLLVLVTVAVYAPVRRAGFIWDDDDHLTRNPAMTAPDGLRMIWSSLAVARYYPLTLTTFWFEHHRWGLNPAPYHKVNVLLHALNAALLLILLRRLQIKGAWFAAFLWALHPVCVESVAWVTELKNIQSGFFFLLTLLAYVDFDERPDRLGYLLMLVCAAAAMLSKSSAVVLPLVILLLIWWRRGTVRKLDWWRVGPLFADGLGMALWTIREQRYQIARSTTHQVVLSLLQRCLLAGKAVWFYLGKILWPSDLTFLYPHWDIDPQSIAAWLPLLALAGVIAGLIVCRRQPWASAALFCLGYFIVVLLPMLGFIDLYFFRYSYVADHFQYLACIGPIVLAAAAGSHWIRWRWVRGPLAAIILLIASGLSWQYTHSFENLEVLWRDVLDKNPTAWLAHNNLGAVLVSHNNPDEVPAAADEYAAAIRLKPDFAEAHSNLGNLLAHQRRFTAAAEEYAAALRCDPDFAGAYYNLAGVCVLQGRLADAIANYQAALRLRPDFPEARYNLDLALKKQAVTR